jgi:L-iditol 2-dehydrogenase
MVSQVSVARVGAVPPKPANATARLPESVSQEYGAIVEPLSVAMHARARANPPENATVLVLGAGAVGLLCAAVSKAAKAKAVIIADIQEDRVNFAVANGFADAAIVVPAKRPATIEDKLAFAKEVAELVKAVDVNGHKGEVVMTYECTGVESCLQSAIYVRNI